MPIANTPREFWCRASRPRRNRRFALKKPCSRKGGVLPLALCYQHPKFSGPVPTCFIRGAGKYGRSASCFRDNRTPISECGFINTNHTRRAGPGGVPPLATHGACSQLTFPQCRLSSESLLTTHGLSSQQANRQCRLNNRLRRSNTDRRKHRN